MHSSLWLTVLVWLPLLGAAAALLARRRPGAPFAVAVVTASVELAVSLIVAVLYNDHLAGAHTFDFVGRWVVAAPFGLAYDVALDGISLFLVVLAALILVLAVFGARDKRHEPAFVSWLLLLTSFTIGSFVAHDLLEFFVFFELTLVPSYFIVAQWGGRERAKAALKFFVYTFAGSAFLFTGLLYLGFMHQHQTGGRWSRHRSRPSARRARGRPARSAATTNDRARSRRRR